MTDQTILDDAFDLLGDRAPEYGGGLANHGPMAAETLVHIGLADAVPAWAARYVGRLDAFVDDADRHTAVLGDGDTYAAWLRLAQADLAGVASWRDATAAWALRHIDGAVAAAGHGVLRTAHAVRALETADTPARRAELARGLAYWAANHQRLPGTPRPSGHRTAAEALAALPPPAAGREVFFSDGLRALDRVPGFAAAVDGLDPAELDIGRLVDAMAPVALAGATTNPILYVHTLTVPAAVRTLAGVLPPEHARTALAYTWQAMAGLAAAFPAGPVAATVAAAGRPPSADELVAAAVANGDEHAIKVAGAAVDEVGRGADALLLTAALALVRRI